MVRSTLYHRRMIDVFGICLGLLFWHHELHLFNCFTLTTRGCPQKNFNTQKGSLKFFRDNSGKIKTIVPNREFGTGLGKWIKGQEIRERAGKFGTGSESLNMARKFRTGQIRDCPGKYDTVPGNYWLPREIATIPLNILLSREIFITKFVTIPGNSLLFVAA